MMRRNGTGRALVIGVVLGTALALLAGPALAQNASQSQPKSDDYAQVLQRYLQAARATPATPDTSWAAGLFADVRARRLNDLVTVRVVENISASGSADSALDKKSNGSASVTNLFVGHNRFHDFAYHLGFTEGNYNLQQSNFGATEPGRDLDPEIGNVQAGALTGGAPSYLGRDNANQIALQDGIPGITNQYLFQPIAGAFYSPCTDGSLDMSIVGHEYTHAISNRMIGGPDEGITSEQGGAMGESWGDLVAGEYMFSHGYSTGTNPWVVGPYATGNKTVGIRDYAVNANPLNYSNYGFDSTGDEVHADGEIWNGTQWEVRQALVRKWNARYPYTDTELQERCAQGIGSTRAQPALGPADVRRVPAPAGLDVDAGRP